MRRLSICIPCYKRPDLAKEALQSALAQTPAPYEILVGDDSPDDETEKMVQALPSGTTKIRYWRNSPSLGQARNVQFLLERTEGDLVAIMHDDDRFRENSLEPLMKAFDQEPETILSFGKQVIIEENGEEDWEKTEKLNDYFSRKDATEGVIKHTLDATIVGMIPSNGFIVRAEEAKKLDYYDGNRASKACDFYFSFRLGRLGKPFYFCDHYTSDYRLTQESSARSGTDSGYNAFKIITEELSEEDISDSTSEYLKGKVKVAIAQASKIDRSTGFKWYFSKWHRKSILTPGGIRRLWWLLRPSSN